MSPNVPQLVSSKVLTARWSPVARASTTTSHKGGRQHVPQCGTHALWLRTHRYLLSASRIPTSGRAYGTAMDSTGLFPKQGDDCERCGQHLPRTSRPFLPEEENRGLPFFAYGIFMPGEIAFFQIKQHADPQRSSKASLPGALRSRDGLLVLVDIDRGSPIHGWSVVFREGEGPDAYQAIGAMEPRSQYRWAAKAGMNVLVARSPDKG